MSSVSSDYETFISIFLNLYLIKAFSRYSLRDLVWCNLEFTKHGHHG